MGAEGLKVFVDAARAAGYVVRTAEQLRANRWLLTLRDPNRVRVAVLIQARPLIHAADVQDLAEIVQLRRCKRGLLWAHGGRFSPEAMRTAAEIGGDRLQLCTALPPAPAARAEPAAQQRLARLLKP